MSKEGYFYVGLLFSALLAVLATVSLSFSNPAVLAFLMIVAQAHFVIAYLYYIDIVRIRLEYRKRLFIFLLAFLLIVFSYYFTRYIWLLAFIPLISLLTTVYFLVHHFENVFYFGENFGNNFIMKKRTNVNCWLIAFTISFPLTFITFAYHILEKSNDSSVFTIWIFVLSMIAHLFITTNLYKKVNKHKILLLLSIPVIFTGPFVLQGVSYTDVRFFAVFWHVFMWMILYPMTLHLRDKGNAPPKLQNLRKSFLSSFLRKTRSSAGNFVMFYIAFNALFVFLFILTAKLQGITPLSDEMIFRNIFWSITYFDLWAFAHITFSFFPKKI